VKRINKRISYNKKATSLCKPIFVAVLVVVALLLTTCNFGTLYQLEQSDGGQEKKGDAASLEQPSQPVQGEASDEQDYGLDSQELDSQESGSQEQGNENEALQEGFSDDEGERDNQGESRYEVMPFRPGTPNGLTPPYEGIFELPVRGATGWAAANLAMRLGPDANSANIRTLQPGQAFTILGEYGQWWNIMLGSGEEGWVSHRHCFINLPDITPSVVYNITNAQASVARSNFTDIPNVTGQASYEAFSFNERLGRYEFIVPALYATSLKVMQAQQLALAEGHTLVIYEAFRPRSAQQSIVAALRALMEADEGVYSAINDPPWHISWFIATTLSNHQRGVALDMSLAQIISAEVGSIGGFSYWHITEYAEFDMPTPMHELSSHAALLSRPVTTNSATAWREVPFADGMTDGAMLLVEYAVAAGFTPMASEWWHFNDLEGRIIAMEAGIVGEFYTSRIYSTLWDAVPR